MLSRLSTTAHSILPDRAGVGPVEVGDEVGGGFHAPIRRLTEVPGHGDIARFMCDARQCVDSEDLDVGVVVESGIVEDRDETFLGAIDPISGVECGQQAFAERGLFSTSSDTVPRSRRFNCRPRSCDLSERTEDAPEMDPGERRQAHITDGFRLVDRELQGGRTCVVVTGLALRSSETGELVRLRLQKAELS
jgi:hypothetical protein